MQQIEQYIVPFMTLQMSRLPKYVQICFNGGHFVAKLTDGKFNSEWIDYVLGITEIYRAHRWFDTPG